MTMSKDRVKFVLEGYVLAREKEEYARLLEMSFGIPRPATLSHANGRNDMTIICRPSQFARFIIDRCNFGMKNGIQDLQAELYVPEEVPAIYDVSTAPVRR